MSGLGRGATVAFAGIPARVLEVTLIAGHVLQVDLEGERSVRGPAHDVVGKVPVIGAAA